MLRPTATSRAFVRAVPDTPTLDSGEKVLAVEMQGLVMIKFGEQCSPSGLLERPPDRATLTAS